MPSVKNLENDQEKMNEEKINKSVRDFYNRVGWQTIGETLYQNAIYEDLRPVSREYLHRCHMRVKRHLAPEGSYYLDAGSGPVQYPEYLAYSEGYQARVCMDISMVALQEARKRVGEHGFYVLGDIAYLPFASEIFDGITALHTIHHVPMASKRRAYDGLYRTLKPGRSLVTVDGWTNSQLMWVVGWMLPIVRKLRGWWERSIQREEKSGNEVDESDQTENIDPRLLPACEADLPPVSTFKQTQPSTGGAGEAGTFVEKFDANGLINMLKGRMDYEILVWRSVSVAFLRTVIHSDWGGRFWLKVAYWFEERFPRWLGRIGQYPMVVVRKPPRKTSEQE